MLTVTRSGFYRWLKGVPSRRQVEEVQLAQEVSTIFEESRGSYGSPRITMQLAQRGWAVSRKRVIRLMQQQGLVARQRRKRPRSAASEPPAPAPNRLDRQFSCEHPDQVWVGDITYLPTTDGWRYLAVWLDVFSRRVVGWTLAGHLKAELVTEALQRALGQRQPHPDGLMVHSDQGVQYTSRVYRQLLEEKGLVCSMSRRGNCWDNAVAESFFSTLKTELFSTLGVLSPMQLHVKVATWIDGFYNQKRLHSTLNYLSPIDFEKQYQPDSILMTTVA